MPQALEQTTALDRFYNHLAFKPWCGDDKLANLVRPKHLAVKKSYIAPNQPALQSWLVFDLDHDNSWIWEDENLPPPNLIVANPANGRAHLYYAIMPVCTGENGRQHPIDYMQAVYRGLAKALRADESYVGRIAKNPMCQHWRTLEMHSFEYSLGELAEYVELSARNYITETEVEDTRGRNCTVFNNLRLWSYPRVKQAKMDGSYEDWLACLTEKAHQLATIEVDFKINEVEGIARSVARWTWQHYSASRIDRGVMGLVDTDLPLQSRQRLSARRTHKARREVTELAITKAIKHLQESGERITKAAVARLAGISRQQIYNQYTHLFNKKTIQMASQLKDFLHGKSVNFGVYQISAPVRATAVDVFPLWNPFVFISKWVIPPLEGW